MIKIETIEDLKIKSAKKRDEKFRDAMYDMGMNIKQHRIDKTEEESITRRMKEKSEHSKLIQITNYIKDEKEYLNYFLACEKDLNNYEDKNYNVMNEIDKYLEASGEEVCKFLSIDAIVWDIDNYKDYMRKMTMNFKDVLMKVVGIDECARVVWIDYSKNGKMERYKGESIGLEYWEVNDYIDISEPKN